MKNFCFFMLILDYGLAFEKVNNEKVKFVFDGWKYNFGWQTFGGGYIRHLLLFTDSHIVVIKTNHISRTPNVSRGVFFDNPSSIEEAILNAILNEALSYILPDPQEKMEEEIKNAIKIASENPTVENFFNSISLILKKRNLKCEIKEVISYKEIENVEIKGKGVEVKFKFKFKNKKYEYIANYNDHELADKVRNSISEILKGVQSDKNYLSVFFEETKKGDEIKQNTLFLELGGQGIFLSINADYRVHLNFTFRAGLSYLILGWGIPLSLNYITGKNSSHHLELGFGITFGEFASIFGGSPVSFAFPTANLGYRYQPKNGGFVFRISFTPLFLIEKSSRINRETGTVESYNQLVIKPFAGISLGYTR